MSFNLDSIKKYLKGDYQIIGKSTDLAINNVKPIDSADSGSLVWIKGSRKDKQEVLERTPAPVIVCDSSINLPEDLTARKCFIVVPDPKLVFLRIAEGLFSKKRTFGIHPTAVIDPEAVISPVCYIGPNTYVGKSKIGDNTYIDGNCFIYDDVVIGNYVHISANTTIGSDGFGYQRNEKLEFEKFPHLGGVIIEDYVDIGANTCIDRGTLGNTIIKEGAKIDNLIHVAHNVVVGRHTAVIANAMLGGSVELGDYSWVAPSASILNQIKVGEKATIGMAAVVTKDVPADETWAGMPARPMKEFVEIQKAIKNLIKGQ